MAPGSDQSNMILKACPDTGVLNHSTLTIFFSTREAGQH